MVKKKKYYKKKKIDFYFLYKKNYIIKKFLNKFMREGKKGCSEIVLLKCFIFFKHVSTSSFPSILCKAIKNTSPNFEVITKRIGGGFYKIPTPTVSKTPRRKLFLGVKIILNCAKAKKKFSFFKRVSLEVLDSSLNVGLSVQYCKKMYEEAFLNRAFLTYSFRK
jgi:small subunit ribosomal protein S7